MPEKRATNPVPDQEKRGCAGSVVMSTRPNHRTPAATTRGFKEPEIALVADLIADVLDANGDAAVVDRTRGAVLELCHAFPVYGA